jgi:hypothetical protein
MKVDIEWEDSDKEMLLLDAQEKIARTAKDLLAGLFQKDTPCSSEGRGTKILRDRISKYLSAQDTRLGDIVEAEVERQLAQKVARAVEVELSKRLYGKAKKIPDLELAEILASLRSADSKE